MLRNVHDVTAALPIVPTRVHSEWFKNLSGYFVFAVRFCNCISTMFSPLHYTFSFWLLANLRFFDIKLDWICYRSHNKGSLYAYQLKPIEKQIEGKEEFLCKIFKRKLCWYWLFFTHELKYQKLGFVTVEFQLQ